MLCMVERIIEGFFFSFFFFLGGGGGIAIQPHGNTFKCKYSTQLQDLHGVGKKKGI